ncbi:MAG TPA: hypothetical protein VLJ76_04215 [Gaiellaceae bacterium]|nr:hypothetical protein [Gaiellaceae bacterium]
MPYGVGTTERERYESALAGLWESLTATMSRLEAIAASPKSFDGGSEQLPVLQNRLHWAGELVAGIDPPPGAERAHAELSAALEHARDATGEIREALETEGTLAAWRIVHEWRGALFTVRLARRRLAAGAALPARAVEPAPGTNWAAALATVLVLAGTAAFTAGAIATLWPIWALGLGLVAASFVVFEP